MKTLLVGDKGTGNWIEAIAIAPDGVVWVIASNKLFSFDGIVWSSHSEIEELAGAPIWSLAVTSDGALWLGTEAGIYRYQSQ